MTRSPDEYLQKARSTLEDAEKILSSVPRVAAREAYMAAFHAAEALILARTGKIAKTHRGVNVTFAQVARDEPTLGLEYARFLAASYELKQSSDYGFGPHDAPYGRAEAEEVMASAASMINVIALLLGSQF